MTIRVLVADDQPLIRAGFAVLVDAADDLVIVGQAIDGADALRQARTSRPDVVLMDIRMPGVDGLTATEAITSDPALRAIRVLVLTTFEADEYIVAAIRAGASGFLGKGVEPAELLSAIRVVAAGEALLSPRATSSLIARFLAQPGDQRSDPSDPDAQDGPPGHDALGVLTEREREVVALVAHGLSNDDIGHQLHLSPLTAKTHVNRAMMKLGARDRAQLVVQAYQAGLVRIDGLGNAGGGLPRSS